MTSNGYVQGFEIDPGHALHIYRGSLVQVQADALVSSDDNYLSAGGGVSLALARAAGLDVRRECARLLRERRPSLGDVVRTTAGGLPCRYLYHAITIEYDRHAYVDEAALRRLIVNLLEQASADGVRSLGMPALGTGAAFFDLGQAAEIIIDELLLRLVDTPIRRVVLALVGDDAERLFYEQLVRSRSDRLAVKALRRCESRTPESRSSQRTAVAAAGEARTGELAEAPGAADNEVIEQFANLVDEVRLASTTPDRPRLVDGLADLILGHADESDVESELLSSPVCHNFRGTLKQRLMEFLYLSENNLRVALGPTLFKNKDLRGMLGELGEDSELPRDQEQLVGAILRALCFNTLTPPSGMAGHIGCAERLLAEVRDHDADERKLPTVVMEAGKVLEQVLKDLLRMYAYLFWGGGFEGELVKRKFVRNSVLKLTIGEARVALEKLDTLVKNDVALRARWAPLKPTSTDLLPRCLPDDSDHPGLECQAIMRDVIDLRNRSVHTGADPVRIGREEVVRNLQRLHALLCACQRAGAYPDVLRYEGTFENRNGERFVYFVDEKGKDRKVRTDEKIDPRRHYYCFSTNNPVHLYPTLIPKS